MGPVHSGRPLVLASGSPRRRELIAFFGLNVITLTADIDEDVRPGETARAYTLRLSQEKAEAVRGSAPADAIILAADTTVADGDHILAKPADVTEAQAMLRRLRGRVHQVYTAISLIDNVTGEHLTDVAVTDVPMRDYSDEEMGAYIASGDPFDKAGGYAIQNEQFHPAVLRSGCYANVVGLPLCHVLRALRRMGQNANPDVPLACQRHHHYECDVAEQILSGVL